MQKMEQQDMVLITRTRHSMRLHGWIKAQPKIVCLFNCWFFQGRHRETENNRLTRREQERKRERKRVRAREIKRGRRGARYGEGERKRERWRGKD